MYLTLFYYWLPYNMFACITIFQLFFIRYPDIVNWSWFLSQHSFTYLFPSQQMAVCMLPLRLILFSFCCPFLRKHEWRYVSWFLVPNFNYSITNAHFLLRLNTHCSVYLNCYLDTSIKADRSFHFGLWRQKYVTILSDHPNLFIFNCFSFSLET